MLNSVLEHHLPIAQAAEIMGVSERHTKRLLAAYRKDGPAALAHGNRSRRPRNAIHYTAAAAVVRLASNGYAGAYHTHFTELLREREGIDLSRPTVRLILVKAGISNPRSRRSPQHRFRRRRMPQEGMLVQIDGSQHSWLEERGAKLTLLIVVDDATGAVAQAVFRTSEDTRGYLVLLEGLIRQWGIPLARYSDRRVGWADLTLTPQAGQLGQETLKPFSCWRFPHSPRSRCHQGRLGFTDGVEQQHRIQASPIFIQQGFQFSAGCIVLDQPITGGGGLTVAFDGGGIVTGFCRSA